MVLWVMSMEVAVVVIEKQWTRRVVDGDDGGGGDDNAVNIICVHGCYIT